MGGVEGLWGGRGAKVSWFYFKEIEKIFQNWCLEEIDLKKKAFRLFWKANEGK